MNFVKTDFEKNVVGTDLTPEIVDFPEDMDGIKLGESSFDPSNPTYLVSPSERTKEFWDSFNSSTTDVVMPVPQFKDEAEYQLIDPHEVLWTGNPYTDVESEDSDEEDQEEEYSQEDDDDEDDDEDEEEEEEEDWEDEEEDPNYVDPEAAEAEDKFYETVFMDGFTQGHQVNDVEMDTSKATETGMLHGRTSEQWPWQRKR